MLCKRMSIARKAKWCTQIVKWAQRLLANYAELAAGARQAGSVTEKNVHPHLSIVKATTCYKVNRAGIPGDFSLKEDCLTLNNKSPEGPAWFTGNCVDFAKSLLELRRARKRKAQIAPRQSGRRPTTLTVQLHLVFSRRVNGIAAGIIKKALGEQDAKSRLDLIRSKS